MDVTLETYFTMLVLVILALFVFIGLLNVYLILKNGFYIPVNCWFCNKNSKVLFADRNRFDCPFCLQYNGFDKNGDYNKQLIGQYDSFTNFTSTKNIMPPTNGLCNLCNNNQQLKVIQLAEFVPLNEKNYDIEVEHFEKQLEKAYKLCNSCDRMLKMTIRRQNTWLFGNRLKNLRTRGVSLLDLNKSSPGLSKETKQSFCLFMMRFILLVFTLLVVLSTLNIDIYTSDETLKKYLPNQLLGPYGIVVHNFFNSVVNISTGFNDKLNVFLPNTVKNHSHNFNLLALLGVLLEGILIIADSYSVWWKANEMLCWILFVCTSWKSFHQYFLPHLDALKVFCATLLVISYMSVGLSKRKPLKKKYSFKKMNNSNENDNCLEENSSDGSDSTEDTKSIKSNYLNTIPTAANNRLSRNFNSANRYKTATVLNNNSKETYLKSKNYTAINKRFDDLSIDDFMSSSKNPQEYLSSSNRMSRNPFIFSEQVPQIFSSKNYFNSPIHSGSSENLSFPRNRSMFSSNNMFLSNQHVLPTNNFGLSPNHPMLTSNSSYSSVSQRIPSKNVFDTLNNEPTFFALPDQQKLPPYSLINGFTSPYCSRSLNQSSGNTFGSYTAQFKSQITTFRPLSPVSSIGSNCRSVLSPPKLNFLNQHFFGSRNNECFAYSAQTDACDTSGRKSLFKNLSPEVKSSMSTSSHLDDNNLHNPDRTVKDISRSSSRSSGFISSNEMLNIKSYSLPCSRNNSPERTSLISEPPYHFKVD